VLDGPSRGASTFAVQKFGAGRRVLARSGSLAGGFGAKTRALWVTAGGRAGPTESYPDLDLMYSSLSAPIAPSSERRFVSKLSQHSAAAPITSATSNYYILIPSLTTRVLRTPCHAPALPYSVYSA
jgi:hypothetical protein